MLRKCTFFALTLLAAFTATASADVLVTGPVGLNNPAVFVPGGVALPGNPVGPSGVATIAGASGISYTNAWSNGAPAVGDKVTAIGFSFVNSFTLSNSGAGNLNFPTAVVGVFALEGHISQLASGSANLQATFTSGAISIFSTGNAIVFGNDPTSWVPGGNPNAPTLAEFSLADPGLVVPGPGGASVFLNAPNTAEVNFSGVNTDGDLLFDFISAMDINGDQFIEYLNAINRGLHLNINELFVANTNAGFGLDAADITFLNSLFTAVMGSGSFTGALPGEDFNALGNGANGDTIQTLSYEANFGNFIEEVPEPASIILWGALTIAGGAYGARRRLLAKKA